MILQDFDERDLEVADIALRGIGSKLPTGKSGDFDTRSAEWRQLHSVRSQIKMAARKTLDAVKKSDEERECKKLENAHDILMAMYDEVQAEMDLRDSFDKKTPLTADERRIPGASGECMGDGSDVRTRFDDEAEIWQTRDGKRIQVLKPEERYIDSATGQYNGPRFGQIIRAMVTGPRDDAERRALSEGTDSAGGFTVPTPLAAWYIDKLRKASVVVRAGARTVPMESETLAIARLESDPVMAWRVENAAITQNDVTFGAVSLQAKSLAGSIKVSRELLDDSLNVARILENAFIQSAALEFDRACLFGSGSSNEPTGLKNISGINSVSMGTNGAAPSDYDKIIDTIYELQADNAGDPTAMIWSPRTARDYAKLKDADNNPLRVPEMVASVPKLATNAVPVDETEGTATDASSILMGDFSRMLIGLRTNVRLEANPYIYQENHQIGFFCWMRGDVQVEHAVSFAELTGNIPPA
ncbi:phage major capsid protein [Sphingomicrobium marinum]|uniref:phage major capsid protein n=1 Tax=Sphingomicrobium marinum TaxID=1227950 RepID=UPI00223F14EB|nr:phage major capsid protein [Sphingomicrobium marinum]